MIYTDSEKNALRVWALGRGTGSFRRTCFACAETRKNKHARTLSVTIDAVHAVWMCWHCEAKGMVWLDPASFEWKDEPPKPKAKPFLKGVVKELGTTLDSVSKTFLKGRGISEETAKAFDVVYALAYFPDLNRQAHGIAVPYIVNSRVQGRKVRCTEEKANVCDAALSSLCGLQLVDTDASEDFIICEGEFDMLAMYEAGILNATSVPNGASSFTRDESDKDPKTTMAFLWSAKEKIDKSKRILLASDADEPGSKLADELARRIGKHRCWRVTFPEDCKDANDVLLKHGGAKLKTCVEHAEPWPIEGLYEAGMFNDTVAKLYEDGLGERILTGMRPIDELYSCGPGLLTVLTGIPGHGKTSLVNQFMLNLARRHGQSFAICSFENPIHVHIAKLAEMMTQKHFFETDRAGVRMSRGELEDCLPFINEHFKFLSQDDGRKASLDSIIERIKTAVFRWGISGAVIDPYNYIARANKDDTETQWIDDMLTTLRLMAQYHGIHLWLVAHPTKLQPDKDGHYPPPRGYSISGSAAWYAKADFGLTVYRVPDRPGEVKFINWKTRYDWMGKEGECSLLFDTATNTYITDVMDDLHPYSPGGPKTYREARDGPVDDQYEEARELFLH
jgi:twinkle protein